MHGHAVVSPAPAALSLRSPRARDKCTNTCARNMPWASWDATGSVTAVDHRSLFEFDLNGFVVVRNALSASQVARMNAMLEGSKLFQEEVLERKRADGTRFSFCQTGPMFMELLEHPVMLGFLRNIMGEWFRLDHVTGIAMTADAHSKGAPSEILENLHGGEKGDQGEHHYQYHQGRIYNNLTVVMFMLADVNPGDGGLTVIPGSHKSNHPWPNEVYPHPQLATSHLVHQPSMKAGDMLIFTEALIHGTTYWTGAQDRRLVSFKFCPGHVQYIPPSNPSSSHHLLPYATSELQRQLLDQAWVGRPKIAFPCEVGEPLTPPNPEEAGAGREAVARHASKLVERRSKL